MLLTLAPGGWYEAGFSLHTIPATLRRPCGDMSLRERLDDGSPGSPRSASWGAASWGGVVDRDLVELPTELMLAPSATRRSRPSSTSHSDVSESDSREMVLGGLRCSVGLRKSVRQGCAKQRVNIDRESCLG